MLIFWKVYAKCITTDLAWIQKLKSQITVVHCTSNTIKAEKFLVSTCIATQNYPCQSSVVYCILPYLHAEVLRGFWELVNPAWWMKIKFEVVRLWLFGKLLEGGSSFSESFRSCQPSATYCIDFLSSSLFNIFERERELDRLSYYNFKVPATVYSESSCLLECTDSVPFSST